MAGRLCVFQIQHYSLQDGPGIRTTVFLKGCPMRCKWCCNPESQCPLPERMGEKISGVWMDPDEIIEEVMKDEVFYIHGEGGITLSGGEPFFQGEEVIGLLKRAKREFLTTAVETCGNADTCILLEALSDVDTMYFDIKAVNEEKHKKWTGCSNRWILKNLKAVHSAFPNLDLRVRTPVIPGFNDNMGDLTEIRDYLISEGIRFWELLPYHRFGKVKYDQLGRDYPLGDTKLDSEWFEEVRGKLEIRPV